MFRLIITLCFLSLKVAGHFEYDYYWKDYTEGDIPKHAVKVATNSDIYIAQVYSDKHELIPASVTRSEVPIATSSSNGNIYATHKNIKVLCGQFPGNFVWVQANSSSFHSVLNKIPGGKSKVCNTSTYIGRIQTQGKTYLGVVENKLAYNIGNKIQTTTGPFEVLTYQQPNEISCGLICS